MLKYLDKLTAKFGYRLVRDQLALAPDLSADSRFMALYERVRPYTMTSPERLYALYQAVLYVVANRIPGDFVECGVWKGGSCMLMALLLKSLGEEHRVIYLYDTFEGMSEPGAEDRQFSGEAAGKLLNEADKADAGSVWCYSSLDEVKAHVLATGYPSSQFRFVEGKVEDTIPSVLPGPIALLRLDTDWYESTRHEMQHLYPLLEPKGVLIIDDFGHWEGAKKAVLEYFQAQDIQPLLQRIDYTGRIMTK